MVKLRIALCSLLALMLAVASTNVPAESEPQPPSTTTALVSSGEGIDVLDDHIIYAQAARQAAITRYVEAVEAEQARKAAEEAAAQEAARAAAEAQAAREAEQARVEAAPPPPPAQAPVSASGGCATNPDAGGCWDKLAQCESGGNWSANTGNGYYGGIQFALSSWQGVGGTGYPHEHSRETQIEMGRRLWNQGGWAHWPACTAKFGWR